MDVCKLIVVMTMTTQACYAPEVCTPSADGTKTYCAGGYPIGCQPPGPYWVCKREDGTTYTEDMTRGPTSVQVPASPTR